MLRALFSRLHARLRKRRVSDDARVEGTGDAIVSPQHRRSPAATRELERLEELAEDRHDER